MPDDPFEQIIIDRMLSGGPAVGPVRVGPGDDAAVLDDGTVLTTDTLVEEIHFDHRLAPADVGWKAVAVSASDVGAMGAVPSWALLTLSLPSPVDQAWCRGFSEGLHAALDHFGVRLVGGDTTASPGPRVVGLTMGGRVDRPVLRSGARPGHEIWVTGTPGRAAQGFFHGGEALSALRRPMPPVRLGEALGRQGLASAMMDLSDGIARDLARLAHSSGVAAWVDPDLLPPLEGALSAEAQLPLQVGFGDDYELLFTARPTHRSRLHTLAEQHGVRMTRVGQVRAGTGAHLTGQRWPPLQFAHFGAPP